MKSFFKIHNEKALFCFIIAVIFIVPISLALATSSIEPSFKGDMIPAQHVAATPEEQFQVHIAYAYVGPALPSDSSYFDKGRNMTMHLTTQYPSVVRLNVSCIPGAKIADCDAVIEVYGVKTSADTGPAEYHAYFVGTICNLLCSSNIQSNISQYVADLVNLNLYAGVTGNFRFNSTDNSSILTNPIGSITKYTNAPTTTLGLYSAGKPNVVTVTVYRIGYITTKNGLVTIYDDPLNGNPKETVQLSNYQNGFLHNDMIPLAKLPQTNLFQPTHL